MAELNIDGSSIFVDVSAEQQYPINELTQLLPQTEMLVKVEQESRSNENNELITEQDKKDEEGTLISINFPKERLKCPECHRFTAETEEKMTRHIRKVHRGENPFQCYMCEYSTYNKCLFEEHVRIHKGIKPFKCSHCPYRSVSKKNTKKHELIHRPDNPLRCQNCDFIARNPRALDCHKRVHDMDIKQEIEHDYNICPNCPFRYKQREQLRNHKKNKRRCSDCGKYLCTRKLLTEHKVMAHNYSTDKSDKLNKLFSCSLCTWSSNSKPRILLHLIHHPNQIVDEDRIDISILRQCGIM